VRPTRLILPALTLALAACGGSRPAPATAPSGIVAMAPASAVEQFLGFAAQGRYVEMGHVFGTSRGPIAEQQEPGRVVRRMQAVASVLQHEEFSMTGVVPVSGRPDARRVTVLLRSGRQQSEVPFLVVQGPGGRWLVEMVDVEAGMQRRR
jgi:hypothetical protein